MCVVRSPLEATEATSVHNGFTHFEISLCRESLQAHRATKRFVASVRPHVDLKRGRRREIFVAHVTQMLWRTFEKKNRENK